MTFVHDLLKRLDCKRVETDAGRFYRTPDGTLYPSVTNMIAERSDKSFLEEWKQKVGKETARRVTEMSAARGTKLHKICEKFLLNERVILKDEMPTTVADFKVVKPHLERNVTAVYGVEYPLYSHALRLAGTTDLICQWNGRPTIVDFKTSRYGKEEDWILGYFIQSVLYAKMTNVHYGLGIEDVVIIMVPEHSRFATIFSKKVKDYEETIGDFIRSYLSVDSAANERSANRAAVC